MKRDELLHDDEALDKALASLGNARMPRRRSSRMARSVLAAAGIVGLSGTMPAWAIGALVVGSFSVGAGTTWVVSESLHRDPFIEPAKSAGAIRKPARAPAAVQTSETTALGGEENLAGEPQPGLPERKVDAAASQGASVAISPASHAIGDPGLPDRRLEGTLAAEGGGRVPDVVASSTAPDLSFRRPYTAKDAAGVPAREIEDRFARIDPALTGSPQMVVQLPASLELVAATAAGILRMPPFSSGRAFQLELGAIGGLAETAALPGGGPLIQGTWMRARQMRGTVRGWSGLRVHAGVLPAGIADVMRWNGGLDVSSGFSHQGRSLRFDLGWSLGARLIPATSDAQSPEDLDDAGWLFLVSGPQIGARFGAPDRPGLLVRLDLEGTWLDLDNDAATGPRVHPRIGLWTGIELPVRLRP